MAMIYKIMISAFLVSFAPIASAETIKYTTHFDLREGTGIFYHQEPDQFPIELPLFDPSIGRLISVMPEASAVLKTYAEWNYVGDLNFLNVGVLYNSSRLRPLISYANLIQNDPMIVDLSAPVKFFYLFPYSGAETRSYIFLDRHNIFDTYIDPVNFIGTGNFISFLQAGFEFPWDISCNCTGYFNGYGIASYDFSIVYTYAVPEPESWSLMMVGFLVAGAAFRNRRYAYYNGQAHKLNRVDHN